MLHRYAGLEKTKPETDADTVVDPFSVIGLVAMLTGTVCPVAEFTISASFEVSELPVSPDTSDTETVNMQLDVRPVFDAI
jgi:hypothetical protein